MNELSPLLAEKIEYIRSYTQNPNNQILLQTYIDEMKELDKELSREDIWKEREYFTKLQKEKTQYEKQIYILSSIQKEYDALIDIQELVMSESSLYDEWEERLCSLFNMVHTSYIQQKFQGKYDKNNAFLILTTGVGGDDAEDFTGMIYTMYLRFFQKQNYTVSIAEISEGEFAGSIKKVVLSVEGLYAYGYLKYEIGGHRLVRLSPFKKSDVRQTSFALVEVLPQLPDVKDVTISSDELDIQTYKAQGAGGQHVNKTDSAVRIKHIPTGITVSSQASRSQHQNKAQALKMLESKIFLAKAKEKKDLLKDIGGQTFTADFGSQIRSYVLHPYKMVKDHETKYETRDVDDVFGGNILPFITSRLEEL
jgi:peptide chain release factor 2